MSNADGSTTAQTLAQQNIDLINLIADATIVELPDGSVITAQISFTETILQWIGQVAQPAQA